MQHLQGWATANGLVQARNSTSGWGVRPLVMQHQCVIPCSGVQQQSDSTRGQKGRCMRYQQASPRRQVTGSYATLAKLLHSCTPGSVLMQVLCTCEQLLSPLASAVTARTMACQCSAGASSHPQPLTMHATHVIPHHPQHGACHEAMPITHASTLTSGCTASGSSMHMAVWSGAASVACRAPSCA